MDINQNDCTGRAYNAAELYAKAKQAVVGMGFGQELFWQSSLNPAGSSETDLLREAAWVILCSGFRETSVRRVFGYISLCFCDWESADVINRYQTYCRTAALQRFGNVKKIDAIIRVAELLCQTGFERFRNSMLGNPVKALQVFPYVGPITAFHLAKNLGFPYAKPDRHLQRLALETGYKSAHDLCQHIALTTGDSIQLVDLVLWRYCERRAGKTHVQKSVDCGYHCFPLSPRYFVSSRSEAGPSQTRATASIRKWAAMEG